ncbi:hypothetical protein NP233_g6400 [Leucocoprinus birnbaumii]|uniref:Uncharacterized protein n=1 Tax=Leucocoprinus birnbaumii TaxID=56174 RepID=A0AAD5VSA5_9AGAR|nr:hypothetical protein NP233_g6400 [Leucocoprinus birnbaumii]
MPFKLDSSSRVSPALLAHERDERSLDDEENGASEALEVRRSHRTLIESSSSAELRSLSGNVRREDNTTSTLHFVALQNATTCESFSFSWVYQGPIPSSNLSLSIVQSPIAVNQPGEYSSKPPSQLITVRLLSSTVSTNTTNFTWHTVDLMPGWYMLDAEIPDPKAHFLSHMSPLYVANGTNTTCVKYFEPQMHHHRAELTKGEIAGIIIGAVAAAGLLAVAFAFPRLWRRELPSLKKRRPYYLY